MQHPVGRAAEIEELSGRLHHDGLPNYYLPGEGASHAFIRRTRSENPDFGAVIMTSHV
jgi:hypothetical protein